jgi:hypothetical protein
LQLQQSVENWGSCINSYGLAWIVVATSDLKRTAKELKAAGYPIKYSKSMLPDEPTTEVLITSPFNNQLFLFVQREDVSFDLQNRKHPLGSRKFKEINWFLF